MFRSLRRSDRKMNEDDIIALLENGLYGVLGTYDGEYPYVTPLNYVYFNKAIYFHSALEGHKIDNIRENDRVSFVIVTDVAILKDKLSTSYKSVVVFGKAETAKGDEKINALKALIKKYAPESKRDCTPAEYDKTCVIKITPEHISGKSRQ